MLDCIFYYKIFSSHSFSLNPVSTQFSPITSGRFTSIPSVDSNAICSSSLMVGNLSFNCMDLYSCPLVLKNRLSGSPLFWYQVFSSSSDGCSSFIGRVVYGISWASNHASAFLHVEHLEQQSIVNSFIVFFPFLFFFSCRASNPHPKPMKYSANISLF